MNKVYSEQSVQYTKWTAYRVYSEQSVEWTKCTAYKVYSVLHNNQSNQRKGQFTPHRKLILSLRLALSKKWIQMDTKIERLGSFLKAKKYVLDFIRNRKKENKCNCT